MWELLRPVVPQFRELYADKHILATLERAAERYEAWSERHSPGHIAAMREFFLQQRTKKKAAPSA